MPAESGSPEAVPCPRHKTAECTRRVSVVYADVYAGEAADLLSPRPVLKSADRLAWTGTGLGVAGMAAIWIGNAIGNGAQNVALLCGAVCFAYALAMYGWAAARRARLTRVERGVPSALALWRSAWYCERCDGVFFPDDVGSGAVGAGGSGGSGAVGSGGSARDGLLSASEFRRLVWSAGGYGDLLAAGPPPPSDAVRSGRRGPL